MKCKHSKLSVLIASFFLSMSVFAQKDSSGIYTTATDFQQGKLSYAINYKTEKHKINDNLIFNSSEIKVKHHGVAYSLKKSETYGYRDTKGIDYRFVGNEAFKVLNKGEGILLYVVNKPKQGITKGAPQYITTYYFSTDINSSPQLLTKENLKAAFPNNHKFHDAIDAAFKDDSELAQYDGFHKMYKINHLLMAAN